MNIDELFGQGKLQEMMEQAQQMQRQLQEAQERAAKREVTGEAGGGLVKVVATGALRISKVTIDPVTVTDLEMLQDLITAATNDALQKAKDAMNQELGPLGEMAKGAGFSL